MAVLAVFAVAFVLGGLFALACLSVAGWLAIRQLAKGF